MIAQSEAGAKGKGFWRRRRRKNATPEAATPTPAAPPTAPAEAKPADEPVSGDTAKDESAKTAEATKDEATKVAEPSGDESTTAAESAGDASTDGAEPASDASADDAESASGESVKSADATADAGAEAAAEGGAESEGAETSADTDSADAEASSDGAAESADGDSVDAATGADAADGGSSATEEEPAAEPVAVEVAGETSDAKGEDEAAAAVEADADDEAVVEVDERPRPTVGVVYEPDESPDGFPLEYGNIIVGLPKQADGSTGEFDEASAYAEELAAVESAGVDPAESDSDQEAADDAEELAEQAEDDAVVVEPEQAASAEEPESEGAEDAPTGEAAGDAAGDSGDEDVPDAAGDSGDEDADAADAVVTEETADQQAADETPAAEVAGSDAEESADGVAAEEAAPESEPVEDDAESPSAQAPETEVAEEQAATGDEVAEAATAEAASGDEASEADAEGVGAETAESKAGKPEVVDAEKSVAAAVDEDSVEDVAEEPMAADAGDAEPAAEEPVEVELTADELAERLAAEQAAMALITALMKLRGALAGSRLPLDVVGADEARQQQKAMLDQLDDYILPRLVQLEAPILAVVGGSTGAGKSTLVNSVIGKVVSEPGVLRPTTRSPVLIHHPADADWFIGDRVLPGMARTTAESPGGMEDPGQLRLVASDTVPRGLAVLDAPDIDSVVEANRDLATQLLAAADLWLFVTTAARYSDAVPWEFLQSASDRSTAVAVVLDRAPAETIDDITGHLAQMLLERGLGDSPLFSIRETVVDGNGMLPGESVASIKDWLVDLAADAEARAAVVRRTLHGAVTSMVKTTPPFAAAVRAQGDTAIELRSSVEAAYDQAVKDIATSTQDASLLRGEVLARWQEFVGTGELLKGLQGNSNKLREKVKKSIGTTPAPTRDLNDAIESGLSSLLIEQAEAAAERAEKIWQASPSGRQLLAAAKAAPDADDATAETATDAELALGAMSPDFAAKAERAVREWQAGVLELVRKVGTEKRLAARILDAGVNGLSLSVMVVLFAENAGIPTGAEASIGVGSAVVGQKLLTAVFGDSAVQTLMTKSRADLDGKVHALMDAEFARYLAVLDQHPVDPEAARQLTEAARAVEDCT